MEGKHSANQAITNCNMHISWTQLKKIWHVYFKKVHDMNWEFLRDLVWMTFPLQNLKQPQAGVVYFCEWNLARL